MKKLTCIIFAIFSLLKPISTHSQSCLPEGITFTTQAQIDNFQVNYPGCNEIEGYVKFHGNNINNLNGLSGVTLIGGNLECYYLDLDNFAGFENLNFIGDTLKLFACTISYFEGLNELDSIGGDLIIQGCILPSSMEGLENLISIGGMFDLNGNHWLTNLTGLNNLSYIGGGLKIVQNRWLENLSGLESLTEINGDLIIVSDSSLFSLDGLENINPSTIANIAIYDNFLLSECGMESICNYLQSPYGIVDIYNNNGGCNSPVFITEQCGISLPCLPFGNYYFHSQAEIDSFPVNYPDCSTLGGNVEISGNDIVNLQGLDQITSTGGSFRIIENDSLISLSGLENLESVEGALFIHINPLLNDLSGLQNLETVGDGLYINYNDNLTSLEPLSNLSSINGYLYLLGNDNLSGLTGLDNINPLSISNIIMIYNDALSFCEVQSICEYLADPVGEVTIWANNTGCDSPSEIEAACNVGYMDRTDPGHQVTVYPNPASEVLFIESAEEITSVTVFDCRGEEVTRRQGDWEKAVIRVDGLVPGLYLVRVETGSGVVGRKVVVRR